MPDPRAARRRPCAETRIDTSPPPRGEGLTSTALDSAMSSSPLPLVGARMTAAASGRAAAWEQLASSSCAMGVAQMKSAALRRTRRTPVMQRRHAMSINVNGSQRSDLGALRWRGRGLGIGSTGAGGARSAGRGRRRAGRRGTAEGKSAARVQWRRAAGERALRAR